jgi:hypothetical protein
MRRQGHQSTYFQGSFANGLSRQRYMFIGAVYTPLGDQFHGTHLALAIALEIGHDKEALRRKVLERNDHSITAALLHMLLGPGV